MDLHQQLIANVLYPIQRWRKGEWKEVQYLREYERTQFLSSHALRELQWKRLQYRLLHAYEHCPFYRHRWDDSGVHPSDVKAPADMMAIPILRKADIQRHRDSMVAENMPRSAMFIDQTGGSTGHPISYYQSYDAHLSRTASTIRHNRWAHHDIGDSVAWIWGASRDNDCRNWKAKIRNAVLDRRLILNTACVTEEQMRAYICTLKVWRPKVFVAYARALSHFARFLKDEGIQAYQPRAIITSAEVLEPEDRTLIEEVFGCRVFDRYGCREVGVVASECEFHNGMHINAEGLYVEVVVGNRLALPGEVGKVLITDLLNFAMPLVRYEIGDMAASLSNDCPCGRGLPRISAIAGRVTDFIVGHDGRRVSGVYLATYVVANRPTLGQVQIQQEAVGQVKYRLVLPDGQTLSAADQEYLTEATKQYVGASSQVLVECVESLPLEPSGKYVFCKSSVSF